jgi:endoglucanase
VLEEDFRWMAEWGFNFARIPMSYLLFIADSRRTLAEERLAIVDEVVEHGRKYGIHVSLNIWRAPGHTNFGYPFNEPEPGTLWTTDPYGSLEIFTGLWSALAKRYKGIPSSELSFDLVNEPPATREILTTEDILNVFSKASSAIRAIDPERLVLVEGLEWGDVPAPADWSKKHDVAQSVHITQPLALTHYRCEHTPDAFDVSTQAPSWPMRMRLGTGTGDEWIDRILLRRGAIGTDLWNRDRLEEALRPWIDLAASGVPVHAGEVGTYKTVPHDVAIAYLDDLLSVLTEHDIGFALWNLRGPFGLVDSGRTDLQYEDWHGSGLDRQMLKVMQKHGS